MKKKKTENTAIHLANLAGYMIRVSYETILDATIYMLTK